MRKLMVLASMLAMMLVAAAPAMAQEAGSAQYSEQNASAGDNSNINQQVCQNSIGDIDVEGGDNVAASQYQYGDVEQENSTEVNVAQQCAQPSQQSTGDIGSAEDSGSEGASFSQFNFFGLSNLFG